MNTAYTFDQPVDLAQSRAAFIRKTYGHVAGATLAFAVLLAAFISIEPIRNLMGGLLRNKIGWLAILVAYMAGSWVANKMAHDFTSRGKQYAGLGVFVLLEALIFVPLMTIAMRFGQGVLPQAIMITVGLFVALSAVVFITKHDFSWLRTVVTVGSIVALVAILAGIIFGFNLGFFFICAMIVLMAAAILYTTGQVMNDYPEWAYVGASLALFSSLTTLFWYVIQFVMSMASDD